MRLVVSLLLVATLAAQDPEFEARSRLVLVPVIVADDKGRSIDGLEARDFAVSDNGIARRVLVDSFATGVAPIALTVAVQTSGISIPVLEKVQKIGSMIQPLITGQRGCASLLSFDEEIRWRQDCTRDPDALSKAFAALEPGAYKKARMLDAVNEAVGRLRSRTNVRRVLLLISESRDRGSEEELERVVMTAEAAGVAVYACTYSVIRTAFTSKSMKTEPPRESQIPRAARVELPSPKGRVAIPAESQRVDILGGLGELVRAGKTNDVEALARYTGGTTYSFHKQKGLEDAIERVGAELHNQYVLSFSPEGATPGYHRIEIRLTRPGKFRIRARPGYWAQR